MKITTMRQKVIAEYEESTLACDDSSDRRAGRPAAFSPPDHRGVSLLLALQAG
jgi:hypothetical protein